MAGRPTDYRTEYCEQVEKLCKLGATDKEIADFFDVAESTINNWKTEHTEFLESIKRGKIKADAQVAESLFKRANGYNLEEITYERQILDKGGSDDEEEIKVDVWKKKVTTKHLPPDTTAIIYWLKNRRGKVNEAAGAQKWADKHEHVHDGSLPVKLIFESDPANEPINDKGD